MSGEHIIFVKDKITQKLLGVQELTINTLILQHFEHSSLTVARSLYECKSQKSQHYLQHLYQIQSIYHTPDSSSAIIRTISTENIMLCFHSKGIFKTQDELTIAGSLQVERVRRCSSRVTYSTLNQLDLKKIPDCNSNRRLQT